MKGFGIEKLSVILRYILSATFCVGILATVFLSYILKHWFAGYFVNDSGYYYACLAIMTPCGILSLVILYSLIRMFRTIDRENPFVYENANWLRTIACCCILISVLFFVLVALHPTLPTFIVAYIFFIGGLACFVFSRLFRKAVDYKHETDYTI